MNDLIPRTLLWDPYMDQWCESAIYFTFSLAIILKVGLFNNIGELS